MSWLSGDWGWWIAGGVLLLIELAMPGVFFVWFALAAFVMGVLHLVLPLPLMAELVVFGVLAVAFALTGRAWLARRPAPEAPVLNQRQLAHVGRRYRLAQPITDGRGMVIIDDTRWEIEGPDLPAGAWVEVTGADGMRLTVKPSDGPTTRHPVG